MSESNIVFSTDPDFKKQKASSQKSVGASSHNMRIHLDRRGGGKIVTIIRGYNGATEQLLNLQHS